ncbi:hypothetical protein RHA65_00375 [Providencia rettgeri]|uniref:hypothetical protein n=1 Tax=Providencia rettgeri TaxID=587 RepID=UPI001B395A64|nr:hypothetical protein [Providencia rettgeri]ELR5135108.1 hypothetical protein [Providencia rettgeri]MBQ0208684.1 hypothetical protein [Providencia rettgeri]MDR9613156.1 hypothetical protein [Providencia rettgeri]
MYLHVLRKNPVGKLNVEQELIKVSSVEFTSGFSSNDRYYSDVVIICRVDSSRENNLMFIELKEGDVFQVLSESGAIPKEYKK